MPWAIRLSPMLRAPLDALSCIISCHIISLKILKNPNSISNHTNILTHPYIFHSITHFPLNLIT
ncbi:hypothetical protein Hanom_Chr15g01414131 [Helianthus anomalus]